MKSGPLPKTPYKNKLETDQRAKTVKLVADDTGETSLTLDEAMISRLWHQEHRQQMEEQMSWASINVRNFCTKNTVVGVKRQPTGQRKHHTSSKDLVNIQNMWRILTKQIQEHNAITKVAQDVNRHFSEENRHVAKKPTERCSTLTDRQGNGEQTHSGEQLHVRGNADDQNTTKKKKLLARNWSPCALLGNTKRYRDGAGGEKGAHPEKTANRTVYTY